MSATSPETTSIGVAARVALFSPARPRAMDASACVTGSICFGCGLYLFTLSFEGQPA
jgi:hypothetical protein